MLRKNISLKELKQQHSFLLKEIADKTRQYITLIIYDSSPNPRDPLGGSGTFVSIGSLRGILTNEHVLREAKKQNPNFLYIPCIWPNTGLISLRIAAEISLPEEALEGIGLDVSFILLDDSDCEKILKEGKQFWSLNEDESEFSNGNLRVLQTNLNDYLWLAQGGPFESRELKIDESGKKYWWYPNACDDFLGPNVINTSYCYYYHIEDEFTIDQISCFVDKEGEARLPGSFGGMSGAAVWRIALIDFNITEIHLAGIATSEEGQRGAQIDTVVFHGPVTLYQSFYPYCLKKLNSINSPKR